MPFGTPVEFHTMLYGLALSTPTVVPLTASSTRSMAISSVAAIATVTLPLAVLLAAGAVIFDVGGW